jgi:hypothetical protein
MPRTGIGPSSRSRQPGPPDPILQGPGRTEDLRLWFDPVIEPTLIS